MLQLMGVLALENSVAPCPKGLLPLGGWMEAGKWQAGLEGAWQLPHMLGAGTWGLCQLQGPPQEPSPLWGGGKRTVSAKYSTVSGSEDTYPPRSRLSHQPSLLQPSKSFDERCLRMKRLPCPPLNPSNHPVCLRAADALEPHLQRCSEGLPWQWGGISQTPEMLDPSSWWPGWPPGGSEQCHQPADLPHAPSPY